jgi:multicomponent Na+:H+ antiporter subunit E
MSPPPAAERTHVVPVLLRRTAALARLAGFFAVDLVRANLEVAREVLSRRLTMHAAVVEVPVGHLTDGELFALSGMLALTPGTLPVDLDRRRGVIVLHVVHGPSGDAVRRQVHRLRGRLLAVTR